MYIRSHLVHKYYTNSVTLAGQEVKLNRVSECETIDVHEEDTGTTHHHRNEIHPC